MRTMIAVLAASMLTLSGIAYADTDRAMRVSTYGLNLETKEGVAALHRRIVSKARDVCLAQQRIPISVYESRMVCVREVVDSTIASSKVAGLRAFHASLTPEDRYSDRG